MALVVRFPAAALRFSPSSPAAPHCYRHRRRHRKPLFSKAAVRAEARREGGGGAAASGAAVVWFKNDLRVDDHPGLVAAAARHRIVVPLYVFDPRLLSDYSDVMLGLLLSALEDLKELLKSQGSDLIIGLGSADDIIANIVNEVKASHVFAEEEVEYSLRNVIVNVETTLSASTFSWGSPELVFWRSPLYDIKNLMELPESYDLFLKMRAPTTVPLAAPILPVLNMESNQGALPTLNEVKKHLKEKSHQVDESWVSLKNVSAKTFLRKEQSSQVVGKTDTTGNLSNYGGNNKEISATSSNIRKMKLVKSMFASENASEVKGGTNVVLDALAAYLRYLEGTARDDWQELHEKLRKTESRKGASFFALFGPALKLGVISRRKVYYEAIKYEKERNAGFLSPFGYSAPTVTAAVDAICSMEWYWLLALNSQICNKGMYPIRIWRWKGYIIQYAAVGNEGPAILFVHGFGAFLEHFRDNIASVAEAGNRVWAITLLGFGKSEKPNTIYSELMWAELLRDFIVDVVGEPAHLVGNSIGGYIVAIVAGLWPALVQSLVLINTAGSIVPSYSSVPLIEEERPSGLAWLQARLLLLYLRTRAGNILKNCYPAV
ncbi:uncharacterized protein LOC109712329 isoform X2 [Ananas comosus]|uniref:Uncharacterized protein LOC109712329 isoform X2 n=1 Tax=Ananas comosus TaxID=4615 RepID=A0A6P5F605_ANACO|nr:uncharacterized protein LOC109712329 isoform X2 [Ananas comosus]